LESDMERHGRECKTLAFTLLCMSVQRVRHWPVFFLVQNIRNILSLCLFPVFIFFYFTKENIFIMIIIFASLLDANVKP
jgi:hypothetical protein